MPLVQDDAGCSWGQDTNSDGDPRVTFELQAVKHAEEEKNKVREEKKRKAKEERARAAAEAEAVAAAEAAAAELLRKPRRSGSKEIKVARVMNPVRSIFDSCLLFRKLMQLPNRIRRRWGVERQQVRLEGHGKSGTRRQRLRYRVDSLLRMCV
jgi:hypothetical protein